MQNLRNQAKSQLSQDTSQILSPVLHTIHRNKGVSIFQLKQIRKDTVTQRANTFELFFKGSTSANKSFRNKIVSNQSTLTISQRFCKTSEIDRKLNPQSHINIFDFNVQQKKAQQESKNINDSSKKLLTTNSKVKRHLVQKVDYNGIQQKFYQKRLWISRYEHFIEQKSKERQRKIANSERNHENRCFSGKKTFNNPFCIETSYRRVETQQKIDEKYIELSYQTLGVRTIGKKKFWYREKPKQTKQYKLNPPQKVMKNDINFVMGRSLRTVVKPHN